MEYNDLKKRKRKDLIFKAAVLVVLIGIVFALVDIRKKVIEHYEAFDENPLLFGAKKYSIDECSCKSGSNSFKFNQEKLWKDKTNPTYFQGFLNGTG